MKASALIEARLNGTPLARIVEAAHSNRDTVSTLPDDTSNFFGTMISQVETTVQDLKKAVLHENLASISRAADSLQELFQMIGDTARDSSRADK